MIPIQDLFLSKTLNPPLSLLHHHRRPSLSPFSNPLRKTLKPPPNRAAPKPLRLRVASFSAEAHFPAPLSLPAPHDRRRDPRAFAGRGGDKTKRKARDKAAGRIEGNAEFRRELRRNARRRGKKLAESFFYRLKNPHQSHPDNYSEAELQEIGLGYDRMVRFMDKDDPNLRHPHDWYKYGHFGPYSWRGVVIGDPVRGRFSDERVAMISEVRDQEEWERIEQIEMGQKFGKRLGQMERAKFRYFWVFVRHPRWRLSELPWEQWTLVSEVVLEAGDQRIDKWNLMGRLGNVTRSLITKCAAWMRPDIIYVKKPVYQCRFEPQDGFFRALVPFLDPNTEQDFLFEVEDEEGRVGLVTYFGGLCKLVRVSPKAFVDDVVKAFEKLSDEKKSECLGFLLRNHPVQLLHPYTKEWKAKLEELELGCDAPDEEEEVVVGSGDQAEIVDWIEEEEDGDDADDVVMEVEDGEDEDEDDELDGDDELDDDEEEEKDAKYWEEEFLKAVNSSEKMEKLAKMSVEVTTEHYKQQMREMESVAKKEQEAAAAAAEEEEEEEEDGDGDGDGDETELRGKWAKVSPEEWKIAGIGPWQRRIKKSRIPPELFLRAAVRPFTYRNLVKEIVLTRHALIDGDISAGDKIL